MWSAAVRRRSRVLPAAGLAAVTAGCALNAVVKAEGGTPVPSLDELEPTLDTLLTGRGFHVQLDVTSSLRELMLWQTEAERRYDVALPESRQAVTVVFADTRRFPEVTRPDEPEYRAAGAGTPSHVSVGLSQSSPPICSSAGTVHPSWWRLAGSVDFTLDKAIGISSKSTDWAPQLGIMFHLPQ